MAFGEGVYKIGRRHDNRWTALYVTSTCILHKEQKGNRQIVKNRQDLLVLSCLRGLVILDYVLRPYADYDTVEDDNMTVMRIIQEFKPHLSAQVNSRKGNGVMKPLPV